MCVCVFVCVHVHVCVHVCVCVCVCVCTLPDFHSPGWLPTASVCRSMWCGVCVEKEKKEKKKNGKMKNRDSLARKVTSTAVWWIPG